VTSTEKNSAVNRLILSDQLLVMPTELVEEPFSGLQCSKPQLFF